MSKSIAQRVEEALERSGKTARAASLEATGKPDTIRNILRGVSANPRADTIRAIAVTLGVSSQWLLTGNDAAPASPALPHPPRAALQMDIPVMGTAAANHLRGAFQFEGGVVDHVRRPPALSGARDVYALYVEGTSMEPRFRHGDLVFVHPHRPARIGDDVVVQIARNDGATKATIGRLVRRTGERVVIGKFNPAAEIELPAATVQAVHKVLDMAEIFGV